MSAHCSSPSCGPQTGMGPLLPGALLLSQLRRHLPLLFHFFVAHVISTSHPKYPVRLGAMSDSNLGSPHPQHTALQVVSSLPIFVE